MQETKKYNHSTFQYRSNCRRTKGLQLATLLMVMVLQLVGVTNAATDCVVSVPTYGSVVATLSPTPQDIILPSSPSEKFSATGTDCRATSSDKLEFNVFAENGSGIPLRSGYVSKVKGTAGNEFVTLTPDELDE